MHRGVWWGWANVRVSALAALALVACASHAPLVESEQLEAKHPFDQACIASCAGQERLAACYGLCLLDLPVGAWRTHLYADWCSSTCAGDELEECQRSCCAQVDLAPFCCVQDVSCTDTPGKYAFKEIRR